MRLAILSDVTTEVLARMLEPVHRVWLPPGCGAWMETSLRPPDEMRAFDPEEIWILLDGGPVPGLDDARASLESAFPGVPVVVPDLARIAADLGEAFFDGRMRRLAGMPWSLAGLAELRRLFGVRKALAVDLDGTLWSGAAAEDGPEGIVHDAAFQRRILDLKARGVLLVALSKNDRRDVDAVFDSAANPPLARREDFAAMAVDWEPKSANLRRLAAELGLGTDAFVFVDDSAANRAEMRAGCPEVAVADFPPQLEVYFPPRVVTSEDRARAAFYRAERTRRTLTLEEYLAQLDLRVEVGPMRDDEAARVAQLSQRTNQFTLTAGRHSEADVRRFASDPRQRVFTARASDRLGDFGLIAFVRVALDGRGGAEVLDWAMSCRAMGRRIEFEVEGRVESALAGEGVRELAATWRRTGRNGPCEGFLDAAGFGTVERVDGCLVCRKSLSVGG